VLAIAADITRKDQLVNNAGIYPATLFLKIEEKQWDLVLDVI